MTITIARVGDLCQQIRGVTYKKADSSSEAAPGRVGVLRANNITEAGLNTDDLVYVPTICVADKQRLRCNDVLIATSSGSLDVVGKAVRVTEDLPMAFGAFCKVLRPNAQVHPSYFAHFFQTRRYRNRVSALAAGANINNLRNEHLDSLEMPLPSFAEQARLAAMLDAADQLITLRRAAIAKSEMLFHSLLSRAFRGDL
jgi:type I restriction enzyme S subunit